MTRDSHETISTTEYIQQRWDRLQMLVGTGTAAAKAISEVGSFGKNLKLIQCGHNLIVADLLLV